MVFKAVGVIVLLLAAYLVFQSLAMLSPNDGSRTLVYSLAGIFLVLVARVLQAEKHHRDERAGNHLQEPIASHQSQLVPRIGLPDQDSRASERFDAQEEARWLGR